MLLLGYQYNLQFQGSQKYCNADGFSCLPRPGTGEKEDDLEAGTVAFYMHQVSILLVSASQVQATTARDPNLSAVMCHLQESWPQEVSPELQPYFQHRTELGIEAGILFWGTRVVIPPSLQQQVLSELHDSHPGIVRMKGLARTCVWWSGLSGAIEQTMHNCGTCQGNRWQFPVVPLQPWPPWPCSAEAWERVHINYAGPFFGYMYLVVVDSHS